jgi:Nickel responsive protein SCO4226-like
MNSYLVERYLPGLSEAEVRSGLARANAACAELRAAGTEIHYRGSIFLPLEEACFCRFDGDRPEAVEQVNQQAELAFARITAGVAIAPDEPLAIAPKGAIAIQRALPPEGAGQSVGQ